MLISSFTRLLQAALGLTSVVLLTAAGATSTVATTGCSFGSCDALCGEELSVAGPFVPPARGGDVLIELCVEDACSTGQLPAEAAGSSVSTAGPGGGAVPGGQGGAAGEGGAIGEGGVGGRGDAGGQGGVGEGGADVVAPPLGEITYRFCEGDLMCSVENGRLRVSTGLSLGNHRVQAGDVVSVRITAPGEDAPLVDQELPISAIGTAELCGTTCDTVTLAWE